MFSTPENLLGRDFRSSRNERKPHFKQKCVLRKCCGVSQKQWMLELSNLWHCVQHPWNLTGRDFWSSRNKRKPLSKQKCVLGKCCGVSQKQWMLELSNLCHCGQHPWKLTGRDFWTSRNAPNTLLTPLHPLTPPNGHTHWFPRGSDLPDWNQASNTNELCSCYKHVALFAVTIYKYVHTSPHHIFLHEIYKNAMRTISTPDQFTHILPSTI